MRHVLLLVIRLVATVAFTTTPHSYRRSFVKNIHGMVAEPKESYDLTVASEVVVVLRCWHFMAVKLLCWRRIHIQEEQRTNFPLKKDGMTFQFDTGPSFSSGLNLDLPPKSSNPLRTVLDAIGERVECIPYTSFGLIFPEGEFKHTPEFSENVLSQFGNAQTEWKSLMKLMELLAATVAALPTAALRGDIGIIKSAAPFLPKLILNPQPWNNLRLTQPYSEVLKRTGVKNNFLKNWIDLLCFCMSGLPASGTISAEMAMMMGEFYEPGAVIDCPRLERRVLWML